MLPLLRWRSVQPRRLVNRERLREQLPGERDVGYPERRVEQVRRHLVEGDGSHRVSPLVEVFARSPAFTPERDFERLERAVRGL